MAGLLILAALLGVILVIRCLSKRDPDIDSPAEPPQQAATQPRHVEFQAAKGEEAADTLPIWNSSQGMDESPEEDDPSEYYNDNYWFPSEGKVRKVQANLWLRYQKTNYEVHDRDFDVDAFTRGESGFYVHGYCHRRKKHITLSSLGIIEAMDRDTGEVIDDLKQFLEAHYRDTPAALQDELFDDYGWALYVLAYLAASSGKITKNERDAIAGFIKSFDRFWPLDDAWIDSTIRDLYRPGKMEVRNWVKQAIIAGKDFSLIAEAIKDLEAYQKKDNKEFWTFKQYIEKQMSQHQAELERGREHGSNRQAERTCGTNQEAEGQHFD